MEEKEEEKKKPTKRKKRIIGLLAAFAGAGLSALTIFGATELYDSFFRRYERPDYSLVAGCYCYERVKDSLPRQEVDFLSDGIRLRGYYYEAENSKGLVVVSHGIHAGADDYLPAILYFYQHGYSVFAYNYKGTYDSTGDSTVGMCESLVDLNHAVDFLQADARFRNQPLFLFGHSWGGFASAAVLSLKTNIKAVACVAPFNDAYHLIADKGFQYAGLLGGAGLPRAFLDIYQKILFQDYVEYTGVRGVNAAGVPVLIAHGVEDKVILYGTQSIIARRDEITNPNVEYYIGEGAQSGHDSIWHSVRSAAYRKEIAEKVKQAKEAKGGGWTDDDLREIYKTVDHELYSEVNAELFDGILNMFDTAAFS